jgi:hypothetical protein
VFPLCIAERDIMRYLNLIKCTFISSTYVVFDFTIEESCDGKEVVARGNIIINREFKNTASIIRRCNEIIEREVEETKKRCIEKAKWIFESDVHVI